MTATTRARDRVLPALATVAWLVLAGVWVYAAVSKLGDPDGAVRAVRAYQALPEGSVRVVAWGLPFIEVALAALLAVPRTRKVAAWASVGLLVVFMTGIASVWARGIEIDCGCFGGGGPANVGPLDYLWDLTRDALLAGLAIFVALGPAGDWMAPRRRASLATVGAVAGVLGLAVLAGYVVQRERSPTEQATVRVPATVPGTGPGTAGAVAVIGRKRAPVLVEVYEDLRCDSCRAFHQEVGAVLDSAIGDGRVRVAYRTLPLRGDEAVRAAAATACAADAGAFEALRDLLYARQATDPQGSWTTARLQLLGSEAGIRAPAFAACVESGRYEGWVRRQLDAASRRGMVLTPSVLVNGEQLERPLTPARVAAAIDAGAP